MISEADIAFRDAHIAQAACAECAECGHVGAHPEETLVYPTTVNESGHPVMAGLPYTEFRYRCDGCALSWKMPEEPKRPEAAQ